MYLAKRPLLFIPRANAAGEAKTDKDWRKAYAYYLSSVWCSNQGRDYTIDNILNVIFTLTLIT